jgi:hypothetical protein
VDGPPLPLEVVLHASCRAPQGVFFYHDELPARLDSEGAVYSGL